MTFKVIVAGGGPIGLTAALALSQANIDFVVLEKYGKIVAEAGSDVVISPIGLRIISQLGLFEEFIRVSSELLTINRNDHNGRNIGDVHWFHFIKENFGEAPRVLRRYDLTKLLYEGLTESNRAKILTNKEVSSVETVPEGVTVTCADGTTYTGNMVIGADGAHSSVRSEMRKLAIAAGSDKINEQDPFLTTFLCFWLRFSSDGLVPGTTSETHGYGAASQLFVGQESAVSGIYVPLEKPTRERLRFAETDQEDLVKKFAKVPLTSDGKVTFESAWASRTDSGLVSLEEGVLDHWSWDGRIVLAGDAAHKFTPSTGAGCNNGIIDVVVLVNKLHSLLQEKSTPSTEELGAVFQEYQEDRKPEVTFQCKTSGRATATATWAGTVFRLSDLYVMSWRWVQKYFMDLAATKISKAPSFAFLPQDTNVVGKVPWQSAQTAVSAK